MTKRFTLATLALALLLIPASVALAVNEYTTSASFSPSSKGSKKRPVPVGATLAFTVRDTEGKRPQSMEALNIKLDGITTNGARFKSCSATKITRASSDADCPRGSLIGTGYARNIAGNRTSFDDQSIRCYLTLRLHNAGRNKLALFVKGDPNAPADTNCPVALATAIPINIVRSASGSTMRLSIPESLKHPVTTLTNSIVEMRLVVPRKTTRYRGKRVGMFAAVGQCRSKRRNVTFTWSNEGGNVAKQTTRARCR